jgi:hypothetical protein
VTAIPYRRCPGCGKPGVGLTAKGSIRYVCGSCYRAALAELALRHLLDHPATPNERWASFAELVKGSPLETQEPCEAPPRPPRPKRQPIGPTPGQKAYRYLLSAQKPMSAKAIDRGAHLRKGTASRELPLLALQSPESLGSFKKGRITRWTTDPFKFDETYRTHNSSPTSD